MKIARKIRAVLRIQSKMNVYTAAIKEVDGAWVGWIEEIPGVNCQEDSRDELMLSLKEALTEAIQFNREDALKSAELEYTEAEVLV